MDRIWKRKYFSKDNSSQTPIRKFHYLYSGISTLAIYVMNGGNDTMYYIHKGGYTGHEHLDVFGLINMNGRVYDPWLGRFLSPDPFVQSPGSSQSYNRYSYCLNNPLKYIDPSGYKQKPFYPWEAQATYSSGSGFDGRIGPGSGNHWSDGMFGEYHDFMFMDKQTFVNAYGQEAYDEIFDNVVNSSVEITVTGLAAQSLFENMVDGMSIYSDFIAAISNIILSNSSMSVSSEALCMIYYNSFKEYYDSFYGGDAERFYVGPENMPLFIEWLSEFSVLDPDIAYEQSCPEFTGDIKAQIWSVFIKDPSGHTQVHINPLVSFINEKKEIRYPYFAYHPWSTNKPYLNFDPINIVISGNEYRFIVIWYIPDKL